jgi:hypothetical protein
MLVTASHGPECGLDETPKRSGPTPKDTSQGEWKSDPSRMQACGLCELLAWEKEVRDVEFASENLSQSHALEQSRQSNRLCEWQARTTAPAQTPAPKTPGWQRRPRRYCPVFVGSVTEDGIERAQYGKVHLLARGIEPLGDKKKSSSP